MTVRRFSALLVLILVLTVCAAAAGQQHDEPVSDVTPDTTGGLTEAQRRELERIATLGYLASGDVAPVETGLRRFESAAFEGFTAYVSGDFPGAFLLDMEGRVVHSWEESGPESWARVHAYPDGSVLGVSRKPARLVKLDPDSRIVWVYGGLNLKAHHDVRITPDGTIYALVRRARAIPWFSWDGGVNDDMVVVLRPEDDSVTEVVKVSILEAFRSSRFAELLSEPWFAGSDPLHANSLEVLEGRVPHKAFRPGNVLLSMRNIDALAVLDLERREVVWFNRGLWQAQHEARVTDEGRILLFDNRPTDGQSRIVEYDVLLDEIVWSYTASGFHSHGAGAQQRLPNGNTLITESQKGRIFEISPYGQVVWDYVNPRLFKGGQMVVRVPRGQRVPTDYFNGSFRQRLAK
jgi:hypothetical protein